MAYDDESIPIGEGQTITPPYDVAFMTEALEPKPTDKVYEVGTGSGYQASILSRLVKDVYSVEIHEPLGKRAAEVIKELGYTNIHTRVGDGYAGWPEAAPFDAIIVTCAPTKVPPPAGRAAQGGGPDGDPPGRPVQPGRPPDGQEGRQAGRHGELRPTLFVPMTGKAQREAASEEGVEEAVRRARGVLAAGGSLAARPLAAARPPAQEIELGRRPGPPALEDFEADAEQRRRARRLVQPPRRQARRRGAGRSGPTVPPVRERQAGPPGAAEPGLRRRRPEDRGDRHRPLGPARRTSAPASGWARTPRPA